MSRPVGNVRTLKVWQQKIRQRAADLFDSLDQCPSNQRHWKESLNMHHLRECEAQLRIALAAIDGLTSQAIERHMNGDIR